MCLIVFVEVTLPLLIMIGIMLKGCVFLYYIAMKMAYIFVTTGTTKKPWDINNETVTDKINLYTGLFFIHQIILHTSLSKNNHKPQAIIW